MEDLTKLAEYKLKQLITPYEYEFICKIDERFAEKGIKDNFNRFALRTPGARMNLANELLQELPRAGWVRIGVPEEDVQNVFHHSKKMRAIAEQNDLNYKVAAMADVHDMTESIVTDFTPDDNISITEKYKLEGIAARVIFEHFPYQKSLYEEYQEGKTELAKIAKDLDKIEMVNYATYIETRTPELKEELDGFWSYADKKITTQIGRASYYEAAGNRKAIARGEEPTSETYAKLYILPKLNLG